MTFCSKYAVHDKFNDKFNDANLHDAVFGVVRGRVYIAPA
jgi:hypothetical protein